MVVCFLQDAVETIETLRSCEGYIQTVKRSDPTMLHPDAWRDACAKSLFLLEENNHLARDMYNRHIAVNEAEFKTKFPRRVEVCNLHTGNMQTITNPDRDNLCEDDLLTEVNTDNAMQHRIVQYFRFGHYTEDDEMVLFHLEPTPVHHRKHVLEDILHLWRELMDIAEQTKANMAMRNAENVQPTGKDWCQK